MFGFVTKSLGFLLSFAVCSTAWAGGDLIDLEGDRRDPWGEVTESVLVLYFVEEVCPISNRYVPRMKAIEEEWSEQGVRFFMVYPSLGSSARSVEVHRKDFEIEMSALLDAGHVLVAKARANVTPECAVFVASEGREWRLVYHGRIDDQFIAFGKWRQEATQHDLRDTLKSIVSGVVPEFRHEQAVGCYIAGGSSKE